MRLAKTVSAYGVMWVLVFVMSAGPWPLGIPRAEAAGPSITDVPGIQNFYTPRVFIIFDTSKSMVYRPNDPNSDPSASAQDWDPNVPTADADCLNKFCIGKRALYQTLPKYSPRIELGLSGYNEYYQLTTRPNGLGSTCTYDMLANGKVDWGTRFFPDNVLDDLTGTGIDPAQLGLSSPIVSYIPPGLSITHQVRKWTARSGATGDLDYRNVTGAGSGPGDTLSETLAPGGSLPGPGHAVSLPGGTYSYDWIARQPLFGTIGIPKAGVCPVTVPGYTGATCAGDPCDLTLYGQHTVAYPPIYSGTDQGDPATFAGIPYNRSPSVARVFTDVCGLPSPYNGPDATCNGVVGGCTLTQTNGPYNVFVGGTTTVYDALFSPGPAWQLVNTTVGSASFQLTTYGAVCPPNGTLVTPTSGPVEWRSIATGGPGAGSGSTDCSAAPGMKCAWSMVQDLKVPGETDQHFCIFQRQQYVWQQVAQRCDYSTGVWTYTTPQGNDFCDYHYDRDVFSHAAYSYSYIPNNGDIVGQTSIAFTGNDDWNGNPTPVTYSGGSFSNGDCPNLVSGSVANPQCNNGVVCKLAWLSDTMVGATDYPRGRYTGVPGGPWGSAPATYPAADAASLIDPLFPPNPLLYRQDWLTPTGQSVAYWVQLMANYYDVSASNPPAPPLFACPTCTYQYSYTPPTVTTDATGLVQPADVAAAPGAFSAVSTAMPARRTSGWGQLPDGITPAISWQGISLNDALNGASPAADGPLLRMLSKYDSLTNPTGLQIPKFGDYTPLTGALTNVAQYLRSYIDTDPYSKCGRGYYVMLLTDGEEQPPLPGNDPVGAVTALRNLVTNGGTAVDVKTFVIGFGLSAPSAQLNSMAQAGGTSVTLSGGTYNTDLVNGTAFDGSDSARLFEALEVTFGKILEGFFTRSKPAVNLLGTEMYVGYFRLLNGLEWQGNLDSINIFNRNLPSLSDTITAGDPRYAYLWRYGDAINSQGPRTVYTSLDPNSGNRIFFDYNGCTGGTHTCVSAQGWNTNSGADQTTLETLIDSSVPSVAKETIAFLLNPGANGSGITGSPEQFTSGTQKLSRASDIFHSNPAIVEGASQSPSWPIGAAEASGYQGFKTDPAILNRSKTVYIGANDGMLHAVDDAVDSTPLALPGAGNERWAYVPNQLLSGLKAMRTGHAYGVDGSTGVADVCGPGFSASDCTVKDGWRTLLVGTLGKGGAGVFALDVTDPANPLPKWEVSTSSDMVISRTSVPRLGETWGAPVIARTTVGGLGNVWSVFIGGGVSASPDPLQPWANTFYVLDARTGKVLTDGTNSAAFSIWDDPADPAGDGVASRPTLFRPGDGSLVDRLFFTDTEGKMWKMNVSAPNISTWKPGNTSADPFFDPASSSAACALDVNGSPAAILDATTGVQIVSGSPLTLPIPGVPRPRIFNRPQLALDTTGLLNVYVGTGDSDNPGQLGGYDYFYAVRDTGASGCGTPLFILRFAQDEKVLADPAFADNVIYVTTYLPAGIADVCGVGRGFLYAFSATTGQPVAAIKDPFNSNLPTSKLDLGANPQLARGGIPSAPMIRGNKLFVAMETDPAHPRQIDLVGTPVSIKVKGWQRVK